MKMLGILVAIVVGGVVLYLLQFKTVSWNQKLTIEVEAPSGVFTASSVTEVVLKEKGGFLAPIEARGLASSLKGEAVVVDLGGGKYLFALLKKGLALKMFEKESGFNQPSGKWPKWAKNIARLRGKREIPDDLRPLLVTFTDINDPKSVKKVDPNNLSASFGAGYKLKGIALEITDEKVTTGRVGMVLEWIYTAKSLTPKELQPRYVKDQTVEQKLRLSDFVDWRTMREKRLSRKSK